jgi:hypothetical protein
METGHFSDVIKSFPGGVGGEKWQELKFKVKPHTVGTREFRNRWNARIQKPLERANSFATVVI